MTSRKQNQRSSYRSASNGRSKENCNFNETVRSFLYEINNSMKEMKSKMLALKLEFNETKLELSHVKCKNEKLKQAINLNKIDKLEQYGRCENVKILGVPESNSKADDCEWVLVKIAEELGIDLNKRDIQRAHRLGKKPKLTSNVNSQQKIKSRPVIARFISYKKRNEFLFAKSKLKKRELFTGAYITEDLTLLRNKLLNYMKTKCDDQFVMCHTINGKIRMKHFAAKAGKPLENSGRDEGTGNWLAISSPDDLFRYNIDLDFDALGYQPLLFNNSNLNDSTVSDSSSA